jgi:hypothetical protein
MRMDAGMMTNLTAKFFNEITSRRTTDYLAIAVAVSLPWSTSATSILMIIWLLAFLPTLKLADLRKEIFTPAGGLPLLLFAWAALGMLWADTTWAESFGGLRQFQKLLLIPLLLAYFRHSNCGMQVVAGFIASCIALLILSFIVAQGPDIYWKPLRDPGVPVKNYITQSAEFAIAAFCLFYVSIDAGKARAFNVSIITSLIAFVFIGNMIFVVTSRTELLVIAGLIIVLGARLYGWKGSLAGAVALAVIIIIAFNTSSYLRTRIDVTARDFQSYGTDNKITSTAERLEFLRKSFNFIAAAPLVGHGTGSIKPLFVQSAIGETGVAAGITANPHNQAVAVAIQLGLIGAVMLCFMWSAHVLMFLGPGMAAWFGLVIVTQNILGSLFNSHLFDFTEGWIYVCGVGALGGTCAQNSLHENRSSFLKYFDYFLWPQKPRT